MKLLLSAILVLIGFTLIAPDADARRFGGGRSLGMQRAAPAAPQKAAPAQQQPQQAAGTQQPTGPKWLGPLAGLALGAGLAALFLNNGITGLLAGLLIIGLIVAALALLARAVRGRLGHQPLQYAAVAGGSRLASDALPGGAGSRSVTAAGGRWPAGFDEAEFVRHAKLNFLRLQEAHDRKDLAAMRDFLAPDVYCEIEHGLQSEWGGGDEKTEVLALDAEVIDVAEESGSYIVSVRFRGMIREIAGREAEPVTEVWHLEKPVNGKRGWVVAGIQQQ